VSLTEAYAAPVETEELVEKKRKLGGLLTAILYSLMTAFAASFAFSSSLSRVMSDAKWIPLLALLFYFVATAIQSKAFLMNRTSTFLFCALIFAGILSNSTSPYGSASFSELVSFAILLFNALMLATEIRKRRAIDHFFDIVLNVGRIIIAVSFAMALLGISLGRGGERFSGWSDNPNSLALIIAPSIIVLFARVLEKRSGWKFKYLPFLLAGLYVLVATGSRGSISWILVSFVTFGLVRIHSSSRLLLLLGVIGFLTTFGDSLLEEFVSLFVREGLDPNASQYIALFSGRTEAWEVGLQSIFEHPILGIGIGNEGRLLRAHSSSFLLHQGESIHSSYISTAVEIGLFGATVLVATIFLSVSRGFTHARFRRQSRIIPRQTHILSLAILLGALAHAGVETWLLKLGNVNSLLFWVLIVFNLSNVPNYGSQLRKDKV
jgi:O-antigen ligase